MLVTIDDPALGRRFLSHPLDAGMVRKWHWRLEVHFWPIALERNERPLAARSFSRDDPGNYTPHDFDFEREPTREQFEGLVNCLPWAWNCWHDTLLPLLESNEWPAVAPGHKRAETELRDGTPGRREACPQCGEDVEATEVPSSLLLTCGNCKSHGHPNVDFKITKRLNKNSKRGRVVGKLVVARQTLYAFNGDR